MSRQPTTDLYFRNAMGPWIKRWWRAGPIRAFGQSSFIAGDWFVLVRRDHPRIMREALAWGGRLAYVIDDDVAAGMACDALPERYRARLAEFERGFHRDLLARADVVLAASDALADALTAEPRMQRRLAPRLMRIDPVWRQPLADLAHFDRLEGPATLRMVLLGPGTQRAALAQVAPAVLALLDRHKTLSFTYFANRSIAPALEKHPRARRLEPMTWREYQRWMSRQRFHLALYPLAQTPFDRARSASKLTEHAILGAAARYPDSGAPARALGEGALLAPDNPAQWEDAIESAITARTALRGVAQQARDLLMRQDPAQAQRALWQGILGTTD